MQAERPYRQPTNAAKMIVSPLSAKEGIDVTTVFAAIYAGGSNDWMDNHMGGGGGWWWVMGVGWLVFLAAVVVVVVLLVRRPDHRDGRPAPRAAEDVLADRFARGEIDESEFLRRRDALRG